MKSTTFGILGSGDVGKSLGSGLVRHGHQVRIGSRDPAKLKTWTTDNGGNASAGSFEAAAAFGEILILATLWSGTKSAIDLSSPKNLEGKIVIDATNPLSFRPNELPTLAIGHTDSGGEQVQKWLPRSRVVKAFNTVGHAHMVDPVFPGGPPDMFICGQDNAAKQTVSELCRSLGWMTIDMGGIESARLLEPMCLVWVWHGIRSGTWNHAFKLLRQKS